MKINDIEKMKAEFAIKLDLAEKENALNEGIEGYELHLSTATGRRAKEVTHTIRMFMPYVSGLGFSEPSIPQVAQVLNRFPMTQDTLYGGSISLPYVLHSQRSYGDRYGELSIGWISGIYEVRCSLKIEGPLMDEFFTTQLRGVTDAECSTYVSIHLNQEFLRPCVPEYNFKKSHKKYYGGVRLLIDRDEILRLIEFIKSQAV